MAVSHQTVGGSPWTEQDFAHVLRRWNVDGMSAGVIGAELGRSRNAICGLIGRNRDRFETRQTMPPARVAASRAGSRAGSQARAKPAAAPWRDDEIAMAERLWGEWALIRDIALALGKSYDAVNRFINLNREKFPNRHKPRREGAVMATRPARPLPFLAEEIAAPSRDHAVTFLEVGDRQCRWPLWGGDDNPGADGLCCGAPIGFGLVYCHYHKRKSKQGEQAAADDRRAA